MTYYDHWFEEFVKTKHICVHFFQMKVHFRIYLTVWMWDRVKFYWIVFGHSNYVSTEKTRVLASQMTEI